MEVNIEKDKNYISVAMIMSEQNFKPYLLK